MPDELMIEEQRADVPARISVCTHREIRCYTGRELPVYGLERLWLPLRPMLP